MTYFDSNKSNATNMDFAMPESKPARFKQDPDRDSHNLMPLNRRVIVDENNIMNEETDESTYVPRRRLENPSVQLRTISDLMSMFPH